MVQPDAGPALAGGYGVFLHGRSSLGLSPRDRRRPRRNSRRAADRGTARAGRAGRLRFAGPSRAGPEQQQNQSPPGIQPFETFDASQWKGVPIEPRRWIAHNRIPVGEPGIMSGDGGTGKTKLALQLAVAIPAGLRDWIGCVVEAEGAGYRLFG